MDIMTKTRVTHTASITQLIRSVRRRTAHTAAQLQAAVAACGVVCQALEGGRGGREGGRVVSKVGREREKETKRRGRLRRKEGEGGLGAVHRCDSGRR